MQTDTTPEQPQTIPSSDREMLDETRRRLVRIHAAIDGRTSDDREIVPWTLDQLMALIREIRTFEREHPNTG